MMRAASLAIAVVAFTLTPLAAAQPAFGPEARLSSIAGPSISPRLAAGPADDNLLHAAWSELAAGGSQQIRYARSQDNGTTWSTPDVVSIAPAPGTAVVPAIAAAGNRVVVTWTNAIVDGDLYYRVSADGGATWLAAPQALYPAAGYSRPSGALVDSAGRIHVAWFDSRATGYGQLYYAMSCDNGGSWSPLQRVGPQDDGIDNESPRLAEGSDGTVYMLYRTSREGNPQRGWPPFDHYLLRSSAVACGTGTTWLYPAQKVSRGLPEDFGNTYSGNVVAGRNGRLHMAWWSETRGNNLVYRNGLPKPAPGQGAPGFRAPVDVSRFGPNHLEFDLNTADVGGFGIGEDAVGGVHAVFAENAEVREGFQVGPLYYAHSADGGATFATKVVAATANQTTEAHGLTHNGRFHMIWADFRDGNQGAEIYYRYVTTASAPVAPGPALIATNPYGTLGITGGTISGNTLTLGAGAATLQLGGTAGTAGSFLELDFQGLNLGPTGSLTLRAGAAGQKVLLVNVDGNPSTIAGSILAAAGTGGVAPPEVHVRNANGVTIPAGGAIRSSTGVTLDALGSSALVGGIVDNGGTVDGGASLRILAGRVTGGGAYKGERILLSSFGHMNNPVNGAYFLRNGLQLYPSTGGSVALFVNHYGTAPQIVNVKVNGNAIVSMPSAWLPGDAPMPNNATLPMGATRAPGTPEPAFGGGSIIVQGTGTVGLAGGASNDFVFPGGLVILAGGTLDVKGVLLNQGWTTTGRQFQGVFLEAPTIASTGGPIRVLSNNLNWINFNKRPTASAFTWQLLPRGDGSASYEPADTVAPHLNTYSVSIDTAAAGGCWVCLVNATPVDLR